MSLLPARAFVLEGPAASAALEWLHVHANVRSAFEEDDRVTVALDGALPPLPFAGLKVRELAVDPGATWTGLEGDRVIPIATDLIVRPPWIDRPEGFRGIELVVPRGNAFGSGEHESTQAALLCLHELWNAPSSCCDVGTGSGILALYARTRGCPSIQACDVDPVCVAAAAALLPGARVAVGGPEVLDPADAVVANMTGDELLACLDGIRRLWKGAGPLVLGGLREAEVDAVRGRLAAAPARIVRRPPFYALGWLAR